MAVVRRSLVPGCAEAEEIFSSDDEGFEPWAKNIFVRRHWISLSFYISICQFTASIPFPKRRKEYNQVKTCAYVHMYIYIYDVYINDVYCMQNCLQGLFVDM